MSNELKPLPLDRELQRVLPLGFRQIMVSEEIMDEETTRRLTMEQPKYGQSSAFIRQHRKPISKPEV
ncbi:MAG: hypothetical protein AB1Z98_14060 [Nannocystaceae bacterium]